MRTTDLMLQNFSFSLSPPRSFPYTPSLSFFFHFNQLMLYIIECSFYLVPTPYAHPLFPTRFHVLLFPLFLFLTLTLFLFTFFTIYVPSSLAYQKQFFLNSHDSQLSGNDFVIFSQSPSFDLSLSLSLSLTIFDDAFLLQRK